MADIVTKTILKTLISAQGVGNAVQGRIFDQYPKADVQPICPCITIGRVDTGQTEQSFPYREYPILVSTYSTVSSDQAVDLQATIRGFLHCKAFQSGGAAFVLLEEHHPPFLPVTRYT